MLDGARLLRLGLQLGDPHLFLLDLRLHAHAVGFLLFEQQALQSFRILRRQLDISQHHLLYQHALGS